MRVSVTEAWGAVNAGAVNAAAARVIMKSALAALVWLGVAGMACAQEGTFPSPAEHLEKVANVGGTCAGIVVRGDRLYANQGARLYCMDATDPTNLKQLSSLTFPRAICDVQATTQTLYVSTRENKIYAVKMEDNGGMSILGNYSTNEGMFCFKVIDETTIHAIYLSGLHVIDTSIPKDMKKVSTLTGFSVPVSISVNVESIGTQRYEIIVNSYNTNNSGTVRIYEISDPKNPQYISKWSKSEYESLPLNAIIKGRYVYGILRYENDNAVESHLQVIDLENVDTPQIINTISLPARWTRNNPQLWINGTRLYICAASVGILILDISDPDSPVEIKEMPFLGAYRIAFKGMQMFVSSKSMGLTMIDTTDLMQQDWVCETFSPCHGMSGYPKLVRTSHNLLLMSAWDGMNVYSLDDPWKPNLLGTVEFSQYDNEEIFPGWYSSVAAQDNVAYATSNRHLLAVDITNPTHPVIVCDLEYSNYLFDAVVYSDTLLVSDSQYEIHVLDISNPENPTELYAYHNSPAYRMKCDDGFLVTSGGCLFDLSDASAELILLNRAITGVYNSGRYPVIHGRLAVTIDSYNTYELMSIDLRDPYNSNILARWPAPSSVLGCESMCITDDQDLILAGISNLVHYDLTDPAEPKFLGAVTPTGWGYDILEANGYIYATSGSGGLDVYRRASNATGGSWTLY